MFRRMRMRMQNLMNKQRHELEQCLQGGGPRRVDYMKWYINKDLSYIP